MEKSKFVLILDNGHGAETPGKCSPDRRLLEYLWARQEVSLIAAKARAAGIRTEIIVPETKDISLSERCRRVNVIAKKYGIRNCLFISVHINAAPPVDGRWHSATGWSVWVAGNASQNSRRFARLIYDEAAARGLKGNRAVPAAHYWEANFKVIRDVACPSVLTENLFQDSQKEVEYLLSETGRNTLAQIHVDAVLKYIATL